MTIPVPDDVKQSMKEQRLRSLAAFYFDLQMNKTAYLANGKTELAAEMDKQMAETETSYQAISAM